MIRNIVGELVYEKCDGCGKHKSVIGFRDKLEEKWVCFCIGCLEVLKEKAVQIEDEINKNDDRYWRIKLRNNPIELFSIKE